LKNDERVKIIAASLLEMRDIKMKVLTLDCNSIASCLGHNMGWIGKESMDNLENLLLMLLVDYIIP
tara:strand:+ start:176 stop:373 length:198 start_codon:yes stop_codon:yes gene_type:complete